MSITKENLNEIRRDIGKLEIEVDKSLARVGDVGQGCLNLFNQLDQRILNLEKLIKTNQSTDNEARNKILELTEVNVRTFDTMSKRISKLEKFINMHQNSQPRSPSLYHDSFVIPRTSSSSSSSVGSMRKGIRIKRTHKKRTNRKRTHKKRTHRKRNSRKRPHKNR